MYEEYVRGRNTYRYPPVGLVLKQPLGAIENWASAFSSHTFATTLDLDDHHHRCLVSTDDEAVILGLFSVIYWGYITSGALSIARCNWMAVGKSQNKSKSLLHLGNAFAVDCVRNAENYLNSGNMGLALREIRRLPYVGLSFGTKILAFIDPENVGVLDDKITTHLASGTFGALLDDGAVTALTKRKHESAARAEQRFVTFCQVMNRIKVDLNERGLGWKDQSGASLQRFRAVDVERSLFAIAASQASSEKV